jgi:Zn-finger nucleic acid-binding protein
LEFKKDERMSCEEVEKNCWLYSELTPDERTELQRHVETCAACATTWQQASELRSIIDKARAHAPAPTHQAQLTHRILQALPTKSMARKPAERYAGYWMRVGEELASRTTKNIFSNWLQTGLRIATLAMACFFVVEVLQTPFQPRPGRVPPTTAHALQSRPLQWPLKKKVHGKKSWYAHYQKQKQEKDENS